MGAPSNRLLELAKGLMVKGWEITIITAMPNYPKGKIFDEYRGKFSAEETINGMKIYRYWIYASNSTKTLKRIFSMLSFSITSLIGYFKIKKLRPDIIFSESPPLTLSLTGLILSAAVKSKFVMNVSDIWPLTAKELGYIGNGKVYNSIEKLEKYLYKKSDFCSGQSEEIVAHIRKTKPENVYLFRNGADVNRFQEPLMMKEGRGKIKIVYAGLLGVAQGVFDIIKNINFRELGTELYLYGEGAEKNLIKKFLENNPDRDVYLMESIKRDEIPELLKNFYCALIPLVKNIYGAVPSKIYEAMAAGLPVLFSGEGEGAKIISDNKAGFVNSPKDYEMLKRNIIKLKTSVELRNTFALNCRIAAKDKFDRNKIINEFSGKLQSLLN